MLKIGKLCMSKTLTTAIQIFFITPSDLSSFPFNYCLFDFVWCVCDAYVCGNMFWMIQLQCGIAWSNGI